MIRDSVIGRVSLVKRGPSSSVKGLKVVGSMCIVAFDVEI